MQIKVLKNFVIPNYPAFRIGEIMQIDNELGTTLVARGLVEEAIIVQTMVDNVEKTKKSKKLNS